MKYEGQAGKVGLLALLGMSPVKSTEAFAEVRCELGPEAPVGRSHFLSRQSMHRLSSSLCYIPSENKRLCGSLNIYILRTFSTCFQASCPLPGDEGRLPIFQNHCGT